MKTTLQTFLELTTDKINQLDCCLIERLNDLMTLEKENLITAYESGIIASQKGLSLTASDYFERYYSDPNENNNARVDTQLSENTRQYKKRKRKSDS